MERKIGEVFEHRSTLSAINNSKRTIEKLYWNRKENNDDNN